MIRLLYVSTYLLFVLCGCSADADRDNRLSKVLQLAGENRSQLQQVVDYFKKKGDAQALEAAYFLMENMDMHYSADNYWVDSLQHTVPFDEFDYPSYVASTQAFAMLEAERGRLQGVAVENKDVTDLKSADLIAHIEQSLSKWRISIARDIPFSDFCEFVLPYRIAFEPFQPWFKDYEQRYRWITDSLHHYTLKNVLRISGDMFSPWYGLNWDNQRRPDDFLRLGAQQLLFRRLGICEDIATMEALVLRSQGLPVAVDFVPLWGTASGGGHYFNTVFDPQMNPIHVDITLTGPVDHQLQREPAKVMRMTYSKQPDVLASQEPEHKIPPGFMQSYNYRDVTSEYWETADVEVELFDKKTTDQKIYACVFNSGQWRPVWWGKATGSRVRFSDMPKGIVILPAVYEQGEMRPVGHPTVNGYDAVTALVPDHKQKRDVVVDNQVDYLMLRPQSKYVLYFWDNAWKVLQETECKLGAKVLIFKDVPQNVLMRLVPDYSIGQERPFVVTSDSKRYWL